MAEKRTEKEELARKTIAMLNAVISRGHMGIIQSHFETAEKNFPEFNIEQQRKAVASFVANHVTKTPLLKEYHQSLKMSRHQQETERWERWPYDPFEEVRGDLPRETPSLRAGEKLSINYHTVLQEGWGEAKGKYSIIEDVNMFEVNPLPKKIACRFSRSIAKCVYNSNGELHTKMMLACNEKKGEIPLSFEERAEYVRLTSAYFQALEKQKELCGQMKESTFLELSRTMGKASQVLGSGK